MDCPECLAKGSIDAESPAVPSGAVCCACGLMVTIMPRKKTEESKNTNKRSSAASLPADSSPAKRPRKAGIGPSLGIFPDPELGALGDLPVEKKTEPEETKEEDEEEIDLGFVAVAAKTGNQNGTATAHLTHLATRGGGEDGEGMLEGTVFQSVLNPNRPLSASKRGRASTPRVGGQGGEGGPKNVRGGYTAVPGKAGVGASGSGSGPPSSKVGLPSSGGSTALSSANGGFSNAFLTVRSIVHSTVARLGGALPHKYDDTVFVMVRDFLDGRMRAGDGTRSAVAAAIYFVARSEKKPVTLVDVSDAADVDVFRVGRVYGRMCRQRHETFRSAGALSTPATTGGGDVSSASSGSAAGSLPLTSSLATTQVMPVVDPAILVPRAVNRLWEHTVDIPKNVRAVQARAGNHSASPATAFSDSERRGATARVSLDVQVGSAGAYTPSVRGRSRFVPADIASAGSNAGVHTHPWMQSCPYQTKKELQEAAMRIVALARDSWVSTGRKPAPVAAASVALAARLPITVHRLKSNARVSRTGGKIPYRVRQAAQTEPLDFLADHLLAARNTSRQRYMEVRAALLVACKTTLPWGDEVNTRNMDEHIPDLVVFETTNRYRRLREAEAEPAPAKRGGPNIPAVRDTRDAGSRSPRSLGPNEAPATGEPPLASVQMSNTGIRTADDLSCFPVSFRRGVKAHEERARRVRNAVSRRNGEAAENDNIPDDEDRVIDALLASGWDPKDLLDTTVQLRRTQQGDLLPAVRGSAPAELSQIAPDSGDTVDSESESDADGDDDDDELGEEWLESVLTEEEFKEYVRPTNEVEVLRQVWNSRLDKK
jgi:hypothetical protein